MILRRDATWLSAELLPELVSGRIEGVLGAAPPGATRGKLPVAAPEPETLGEGKQLAFCPLVREWGKQVLRGLLSLCVCVWWIFRPLACGGKYRELGVSSSGRTRGVIDLLHVIFPATASLSIHGLFLLLSPESMSPCLLLCFASSSWAKGTPPAAQRSSTPGASR